MEEQNREDGVFKRPHKDSFNMISDKEKSRNILKSTDTSQRFIGIFSPKNN